MRQIISTEKAPAAIGPYAQGWKFGNTIITSGQLPVDMATGTFPETIEEQTRMSLMNIKNILEAQGYSMNGVYGTFFQEGCFPSRSAVEVARLPKDALVEIEAIAYRD